jgi:hypothetical protein
MEFCILLFNGADSATNALKIVLDAKADRNPWLFDIGTIARSRDGRVRMSATCPGIRSKTVREDATNASEALDAYSAYFVSSLARPLTSLFTTPDADLEAAERSSELHLQDLRRKLSGDSSALVLITSTETGDQFVSAFGFCDPKPTVIRHDLTDALRKQLEELDLMVTREVVTAVLARVSRRPASQDDLGAWESAGPPGGDATQREKHRHGTVHI